MRSLRLGFVALSLVACSKPALNYSNGDLSVAGAPDLSVAHDLAPMQSVNDLSSSPNDLTEPPDLFGLCLNCSGNTPACDPQSGNCVACIPSNDQCPLGSFCQSMNGQFGCVSGCKINSECAAPDGGPALPLCCNHVCTDGASDGANCAKCGTACGNKSCCNAACVDTTGDAHNCGACGNACSGGMVMHATGSCAQSMCSLVCAQGFADCDKNPANGCEANLATDPANCMGCGNFCDVAFGMGACMNGCSIASCYAGYADCDKQYGNGCETAVSQDPKNCGACAKICSAPPNATPACMGGACGVGGCNPGFGDCDGNPNNGCETALATDPNNCGMCANNCGQVLNGVAGCTNGACVLKSCTAPFRDCNMNAKDGCEVNSSTDPNNCGACGMKCPTVANSTAACANSACGFGACLPNFADCNMNLADGCEASLQTDVNNCGQCGVVCANGGVCSAGVCVMQPQCLNPTIISDATRGVLAAGGSACDSGLATAWYRFEGAAGVKLPTAAPAQNVCGTQATGWMNGAYPLVADGVVTRPVCYNWSNNTCNWTNNIQVVNCGAYYVFMLSKPPVCNLRYCVTN